MNINFYRAIRESDTALSHDPELRLKWINYTISFLTEHSDAINDRGA